MAERDTGALCASNEHLGLAWTLRAKVTGETIPASAEVKTDADGFDKLVIYIHA